ncbi:FAD binding domain-containing protein [Nakamurella endophytica]|uniref:FAD-binding molybdopterin dehydrogenase n=1 Tax=Nakamurella endophytica TaxID=1748367 RepID=A0A917SYT1_9ACTN|nr:xanthine dehydrogenase family protein subunit M [Nakamurella endophytica]GGM03002.1 FAD-binding molybdopterin dehydrogenase [Nakamurella endophytica]
MRAFEYVRAASVAEAVGALRDDDEAQFLGGGTNLVDLLRLGVARRGRLVDVSGLPLDTVQDGPDGLRIGAAVRNSDLAAHPAVRRDYPALSQALLAGATGQLRNMATTAGNLLQRTRCLYFQDVTKPCNKRVPGSGCPARQGVHRDLAVLGTSEACIATHPSDMAVALAALDATVLTTGPAGDRTLALDDFHRLPGDEPDRDTVLQHGELVTAVQLPPPSPLSSSSVYRKVRDRASFAFAVGSVAAGLVVDGGTVVDVALAFGAVAHRPWRARVAEAALRGGPATAAAFGAALDRELAAATPLPDNAFKVPLIRAVAVAELSRLAGLGTDGGRTEDGA